MEVHPLHPPSQAEGWICTDVATQQLAEWGTDPKAHRAAGTNTAQSQEKSPESGVRVSDLSLAGGVTSGKSLELPGLQFPHL